MRTIALAVALAVALPAFAIPGYFDREASDDPAVALPKATSATCAMLARYNAAHPTWLEVQYFGDARTCNPLWVTAAIAAAAQAPNDAPLVIEKFSAPDPAYECSISIGFEPGAAANVTITYTGATACNAGHGDALRLNRTLNACGRSGVC